MMKRSKRNPILILLLLAALLLSACSQASAPEPTAAPESTTTPEPTAAPAVGQPAADEREIVYAATTEELLKALRPHTEIHLTGHSYLLSGAFGYGNFGGDYYDWEGGYDGYTLTLRGLYDLSIVADGPGVEIVTEPRYASVLHFVDCSGLELSGFTAGHTEGAGYCTGSVLQFTDCAAVHVSHCVLYGCGTYGLELTRCRDLKCEDSVIRSCSYGAACVMNSKNAVIENCEIFDINNGYNGAFWYSGSRDCALLNSTVRGCEGKCLIQSDYSQGIFLGGCEIGVCSFEGMFCASSYPITVEGCSFRNSTVNGWYYEEFDRSERAVNAAGEELSESELANMQRVTPTVWTAAESPALNTEAVAPSDDGMIHVRTVDELLASLAPNVTIYLEDGVYDLSSAADYGVGSGEYYYWMSCYDGPGLVLRGLDGFTLTAAGPHRASITAEPRYAEVLSFENCSKLTVSNLTAGHVQRPEVCAGGVLQLLECRDATIRDCSLYGCGVLGVTAGSCRNLSVLYTEIHDCSYGAFYLYNCRDGVIEHCNIHDIPGDTYQIYSCRNIVADGATLPEGTSN